MAEIKNIVNDATDPGIRAGRFPLEIGRILLALIFVLSGIMKFTAWNMMSAYMTSKGIPYVPFFLTLAGIIEIVGGLSIVFGYEGPVFGSLLFIYLIPVTLIFHNFWNYAGAERGMQLANFLKNLAIMGGLVHYAMYEAVMAPERGRVTDFSRRILRREQLT